MKRKKKEDPKWEIISLSKPPLYKVKYVEATIVKGTEEIQLQYQFTRNNIKKPKNKYGQSIELSEEIEQELKDLLLDFTRDLNLKIE